jgi:hypothetical protein
MKQKIIIHVTETLKHTVTMELEEDEMNSLIEDLDSSLGNDHAGDLCSRLTISDGEWELDWYHLRDSELIGGDHEA